MSMSRLVGLTLVLLAGQVFAQSVVTYELQIGGDNHVADIQAGTYTTYDGGDPLDGQTVEVDAGSVLNWATTIQVSGAHSQTGHPADGLTTQGLANFVFNLQLETESGQLVTDVDYFSTIHDGASALDCTSCAGGYVLPGATPFCSGAAFAFSFDFVGWGAGRVIDAISALVYTGPYMEVGMYPTVDITNTSGDGQLLGVGAGYGQWSRGGGLGTRTTAGVGIPTTEEIRPGLYSTAKYGIGLGPVVEGQIDTSLLAPGTYVLRLTPGTGTNVLRGDVDLFTAPTTGQTEVQAFAVPANQVAGDTITFTVAANEPFVINQVTSYKTHGGAGEFGVDMSADGVRPDGGAEGRQGGPTKVVIAFSKPIQAASGTIFDVVASSGMPSSISVNGSELTVNMSGATDAAPMTLSFPGISDLSSNPCEETVCIRVLQGDADGSGSVDIYDLLAVRLNLSQMADAGNCQSDVNADGVIDIYDLLTVRLGLNGTVATCP